MIVRPYQHWFRRLLGWHGSVLPKIGFRLSLNLVMSIIAIVCFQWYESLGVHLTTAPFSLLGVALAIFLGFRNNASYARFTEARTLWGSMLITHRSLLRQVKSVPLESEQAREFAGLQMAFSYSMKHQLRSSDAREDLTRLLPSRWRDEVLSSPMPASRALLCLGKWLGEQRLRAHRLHADSLCLFADPAPHGLAVLHPAAVCAGRRSARHDAAGLDVYLLHLSGAGVGVGGAGGSLWRGS